MQFPRLYSGLIAALLLVLAACSSPPQVAILEFGSPGNPEATCVVNTDIGIAVGVNNLANLPLEFRWTTGPIPDLMIVASGRSPAGTYKCPNTAGPQTITVQVINHTQVLDQGTITIEVRAAKPTPTPQRETPSVIVFADLNWDSAQLQSAVAQFIIEKGYGYPTDGIFGESLPLWQSLVKGNIQVFMEAWLPNLQAEWDQAMTDGSVIPLGDSLDTNWQSAFVVPTYIIKGDPSRGIEPLVPDLRTVQDIRKYREVFARGPGGKAVLVNCIADWVCSKINRTQVKGYSLDDVVELQNSESADAHLASLRSASEKGEPWLGYLWGPTKITVELDLTRLEEPPYSPDCWRNTRACGYDPSNVKMAVHPSLIPRAPEVVELLRRWDFNTPALIAAEGYLEDADGNFEEAAILFLRNQEAVWTQWLTHDPGVVQKVRDALSNR